MAKPRQILGISLAPEVATAFKGEAQRRGITAKCLFEELWEQYPSVRPKADQRSSRRRKFGG